MTPVDANRHDITKVTRAAGEEKSGGITAIA